MLSKTSLNTNQNDKVIDLRSSSLKAIYLFQTEFMFGFYFETDFDKEAFSNVGFALYYNYIYFNHMKI